MAIKMHILEAGEAFRIVRDAPPPVQGVINMGDESRAAPSWGIFPISAWPETLPTLPLPSEVDAGYLQPRPDWGAVLDVTVEEDDGQGGKKKTKRKLEDEPVKMDHGRLVDAVMVYLGDEGYPVGLDYNLDDDASSGAIWREHTATYNSNLISASREAADKVLTIGRWLPWTTLASGLMFVVSLLWRMGII